MILERGSRGVLCLVTDRYRLALRLGRAGEEGACLVEQVAGAARAGVDLIHLRERDLSARALTDLASACVRAAAGGRTRVVVNDRVDIAVAAGAAGVQLRGESAPSSRVRAIVPPGFLIGRSVHAVDEAMAEAAGGAVDYLVLGTLFPTPSKAGTNTVIGPEALRRAARAVAVPVLGIGGVTATTLPDVAATGAAGFAAIGWFIDALLVGGPGDGFAARVAAARALFDTPGSIP
jgi:thiamine-phosphate pyrophosphorylase